MSGPTIYLRNQCDLPPGMMLVQTRVHADWSSLEEMNGHELSHAILARGWHCAWLAGGFSRIRLGRTAASASQRALMSGLEALSSRFNAAEVESLNIATYRGFCVAKVTLHSRHIHKGVALPSLPKEKRR